LGRRYDASQQKRSSKTARHLPDVDKDHQCASEHAGRRLLRALNIANALRDQQKMKGRTVETSSTVWLPAPARSS
jgi:hypothetical protein